MARTPALHRIRALIIVAALTLLLLEITLRLVGDDSLPSPYAKQPQPAVEAMFWRASSETGWDLVPDASGHFSNGFFDGEVTTDARGIRQNSREGTYIDGSRNIFFIGDSTTASFEVDDDETAPAVLEQRLRAQGNRVNVLNLGIRGYGTDQSVLRALHYAREFQPSDIVYMYTDNDIFNNNTLQQKGRKYGKGAYIRHAPAQLFSALHYPVPERTPGYAGIVVMNPACEPVVYEEMLSVESVITPTAAPPAADPDFPTRLKLAAREYSYIARAGYFLKYRLRDLAYQRRLVYTDPYELFVVQQRKMNDMTYPELALIEKGYEDNGALRQRCRDYFDAQLTFLLTMLRQQSGARVHVVQFPVPSTRELLEQSQGSPNSQLFDRMVSDGVIASHTNLSKIANETQPPLATFRCPYDGHFCEAGNEWIAGEVFRTLDAFDNRAWSTASGQ